MDSGHRWSSLHGPGPPKAATGQEARLAGDIYCPQIEANLIDLMAGAAAKLNVMLDSTFFLVYHPGDGCSG